MPDTVAIEYHGGGDSSSALLAAIEAGGKSCNFHPKSGRQAGPSIDSVTAMLQDDADPIPDTPAIPSAGTPARAAYMREYIGKNRRSTGRTGSASSTAAVVVIDPIPFEQPSVMVPQAKAKVTGTTLMTTIDSVTEALQKTFFDPLHHCRLMSTSAFAALIGSTQPKVERHIAALSEALIQARKAWFDHFTQSISSAFTAKPSDFGNDGTHKLAACFVRRRKYDETPSYLCVRAPETGDLEEGTMKLLVIEAGWSMLLAQAKVDEVSHNIQFIHMHGDFPISLQVLEAYDAAHVREALQKTGALASVGTIFARCIDAITTDEHSANMKCERCIAQDVVSLPGSHGSIHLLCDAHKIAAVATKSLELVPGIISNMIATALSVTGPRMQGLRRVLKRLIEDRIEILHGSPPASAVRRRQHLLDIFMRGTTTQTGMSDRLGDRWRFYVLPMLFNGDWASRKVQHYCNGCCNSEAEARRRLVHLGSKALLCRKFKVFSRSNWTGADGAIDDLGLVASIHYLLQDAYTEAEFAKTAAKVKVAGNAAAIGVPLEGADAWRDRVEQATRDTMAWMKSGDVLQDTMLVRMCLTPQVSLMACQMQLSNTWQPLVFLELTKYLKHIETRALWSIWPT